ncbi:MAG: GntR family transcriptional regulator [Anaerolineales bacterium]|jgi:DNA-binding GntR family transcriptional regulator
MDLVRIDIQKAYEALRERIITLELEPGSLVDEGALAKDLGMQSGSVREALKLLAHDDLVMFSDRGIYITEVNWPDLEQLSEVRLLLEAYAARLASERATGDDLAVLEALRAEQAAIPADDAQRLFDLDHRFHLAVAAAARNRYLSRALEQFFGLSQRLWYMVLPGLTGLGEAVETHLELLEAIRAGEGDRAAEIMRAHVAGFYEQVRVLMQDGDAK